MFPGMSKFNSKLEAEEISSLEKKLRKDQAKRLSTRFAQGDSKQPYQSSWPDCHRDRLHPYLCEKHRAGLSELKVQLAGGSPRPSSRSLLPTPGSPRQKFDLGFRISRSGNKIHTIGSSINQF